MVYRHCISNYSSYAGFTGRGAIEIVIDTGFKRRVRAGDAPTRYRSLEAPQVR